MAKKTTFSSQAASAAPFTPRGVGATPTLPHNSESSLFNPAAIREFTPQNPQNYENTGNGVAQDGALYGDPFTMGSMGQTLPSASPFHPYANDQNALVSSGATYYQQHPPYGTGPLLPPNYHLYQPADVYRGDMQPWQRSTYDFFMPVKMREHLQKKMFATQQVMPNSGLPQLDRWHSLFPLDTSHRKNATSFGFPSWIYKALNTKSGRHYALRRLEGYRLTNENAILAVMKEWKNIQNANIVTVHEAFTTREFGDSSLIFVYNFHPLAQTLQEHYFPAANAPRVRAPISVPENVLWSYITQIANALRAIHSANLAARCLELSKILWTEKDRIRLAACSILDVVQYEVNPRSVEDLQQEDLVKFGRIILALAAGTPSIHLVSIPTAIETMSTKYSVHLKEAVGWLLAPPAPGETKSIENFISGIAVHVINFLDLSFQDGDEKEYQMCKELENGRIARNCMKLLAICERGDLGGMPDWSETGERYHLKLFRDYVFHQVNPNGKPHLDIGHMMSCMTKLDAGIDEMVVLTSRDNENVFVITYRELRKMFDRSFNEIAKYTKDGAPGSNY
ncbi:hypothetical protein B0T22DRAFT_111771 [Podospora appendiculata]|uniref:PAN2-PAN3 deadenylation complex subunit PAN3 n=1 Tax=Podospora appendiculata TaxID=314037 RepID=A0AAE1CIS2_9PEZI|nr:hypothetical protein B0T22DRAFT_111771 [Podospora appendiculata]